MQDLADLPAEISARLKSGEAEEVKSLVAEFVLQPEALRGGLLKLARLFRNNARLDPLIEVLWENRDTAMTDMYAIGHFMGFCNVAGLYDRFGPLLRSWIASDSSPAFTFSECSHFRYFRKLTNEQQRDFVAAKYGRWKEFASEDFFRSVDRYATFAAVSRPIACLLFERRVNKEITWSQWTGELQKSELLKHILADNKTLNRLNRQRHLAKIDRSHYPRFGDLGQLIDLERAKPAFAQLDLANGLLLCTIHDGHLLIAKKCIGLCLPERHSLSKHDRGRNNIAVGREGNPHLSAFHAVKVLRGKNALLMVPDARREVKQTSELKILGVSIPFADGAPTIAFESGCATAWYTVARDGDRFVPVFVPGPSRGIKESFASFKDRWWSFYGAQVEALFAGDPRNITLWHFWPRMFYAAAAPTSSAAEDGFESGDDDDDVDGT